MYFTLELVSPETVPMEAIIRPLLRGLHHVYLNLMITYVVFSQISVLEIYEWYTFMMIISRVLGTGYSIFM